MSTIHFGGSKGNEILKPVTPDRLNDGSPACGFDQYNQLWVRWHEHFGGDDKSVTGTIVADVRNQICPICQRGWENTVESLRNQEHIQSMKRTAHRTCMNGYGHLSNHYFWHNLVCDEDINFNGLEFTETKNLYGSYWTGPWYRVVFNHIPTHAMVLGSRKRVYHIEIENIPKELADMLELLFSAEKTTRAYRDGSWIIHAWTKEKAAEYVGQISRLAMNWDSEKSKPVVTASET